MNTSINNSNFWNFAEFNRFGIMCTTITVQSCLGGIAVCYLLQLNDALAYVFLTLVTIASMGANAMAIAQVPIKWMLGTFIGAVISTLFILITSLVLLH